MTPSVPLFSRTKWLARWVVPLGFAVGVLATPVLAQSGGEPAAVIGMTNALSFDPDTVRIETGQTVRWINTSVIVHTVTGDADEATIEESVHLPRGASPFDSGTLDPDATFEHTFSVPGTYRYFCIPHEGTKMYGTVIVEPGDE